MHFLYKALIKSLRCLVSCLGFLAALLVPQEARVGSRRSSCAGLRYNSVFGELVAEEL